MKENPLLKLPALGQSIWLDFIRREMLSSGELARMIEEDGLRGVTSNPAIFEKAIAETGDYDTAISALARQGKSAEEIYEELAVEDIRTTADIFRPLYNRTGGTDGFVSLEVSPRLARDTAGTLQEARRLWQWVDRPNVMIKVPGTREGLPVVRQLIADGINVNVTLLFGIPRYRAVAEAYIGGLEERAARGLPLERVASVASFFLSRIDTVLDPILEKRSGEGGPVADLVASLAGEAAIASAKVAYQTCKELFADGRFRPLAARGAVAQRVLWASTGTKNPAYSDVKYIEALIGPGTVNTVPLETLAAYRDHGNPASRLEEGVEEARRVLKLLADARIDLNAITQQLEDEGVEKFVQPFAVLMKTILQKSAAARG
jgi:transaldolase